MYVLVKDNLKNYGNDLKLWYQPFQGEKFELFLDTKKGYLVQRPELEESKTWLIKNKHGELLEEIIIDDDIV